MKKDVVSNQHPAYAGLQIKRDAVADLRGGTDSMRAKGEHYLPKYPAEQDENYKVRLATATLYNLYAKTEGTMSGLVFKQNVSTDKLNFGASGQAILDNFDNKGTPFTEFARQVFAHAFDGAVAILVDAPNVDRGSLQSQEDVQRLGIRPYACIYPQSSVTNWRYEVNPISKAQELTLIVLHEVANEPSGDFSWAMVERYRVFRKTPNGIVWEIWRAVDSTLSNKEREFVIEQSGTYPSMTQIPVVILGELTNQPPLLDLARANIKYYQKESNFDSLEYLAAVPMPWARGRKDTGSPPIIAPDAFLDLGDDGECGWMQIDSAGFASLRDSLKSLVEQMTAMGLSLLADKTARVDTTATEAILDNIGDTAELRVMAQELQIALQQVADLMAQMLRIQGDQIVTLNTAWSLGLDEDETIDLQDLKQRAEIANTLVDIWPPSKLIRFLGTTDEDAIKAMLDELAEMPMEAEG